jgi:hypothetical protein
MLTFGPHGVIRDATVRGPGLLPCDLSAGRDRYLVARWAGALDRGSKAAIGVTWGAPRTDRAEVLHQLVELVEGRAPVALFAPADRPHALA